ncbi:FAD-linked oxidoreductase-like protein [Dichotomocladium elegans]|nr:FAD-linked oxidoreductase-like protein [Dichotomocladium elegans]
MVAYGVTPPSTCYADPLFLPRTAYGDVGGSVIKPWTAVTELLDDNSRAGVQMKTTEELLVGMVVYRLCTLRVLVDLAPHLFRMATELHVQGPLHWITKRSVFRQFCGGETPEECVASMNALARYGIRSILDLSIEADQTSHYDDRKSDAAVDMLKECCYTAAKSQAGNLAAVKITAFGPPDLLLRLNAILSGIDAAFERGNTVDRHGLEQLIDEVVPRPRDAEQHAERQKLIENVLSNREYATRQEVTELLSFHGPHRAVWWSPEADNGVNLAAYDRMVWRLDQVCQTAQEHRVGIMVDAEQSYFQEAIDYIAMNLMAKYNRFCDRPPTVYNTYQMYTKTAQRKLERDVGRAQAEQFRFAAKLVRGAYMVMERKRAAQLGYASPIHDTIHDTHRSFNEGVRFLLASHSSKTPLVFMVATHNRESIVLTVKEMDRHNVTPQEGVVHFGQLYGMQDQISYTLGKNGYSIYKYLPYGKIDEVMPYLLRRAQENSTVASGAQKELSLMWNELKARWTGSSKSNVATLQQVIPAPGSSSPAAAAAAAAAAAGTVAVATSVDNADTTAAKSS